MKVEVPISLGELVDKISILRIKKSKIKEKEKLKLVESELEALEELLGRLSLKGIDSFLEKIQLINEKLWIIEDDIRIKEKNSQFDEDFIKLARSVYLTNDQRFEVKRDINRCFGSDFEEVKSYEQY